MQAVNLLPAYARPANRWTTIGKQLAPQRVLVIGGVVAALAAIALGASFFYERSVVNDKRATLAEAQTRLVTAEAQAEPFRTAQSASAAQLAAIQTISAARVPWETVLVDLSSVLPDNVYLQNMQVQSPVPLAPSVAGAAPVPSSATSFTVQGTASSQVMVALVLDRLALLPYLAGVTLGSSVGGQSAAGGGGDQFTISASFIGLGGAQ